MSPAAPQRKLTVGGMEPGAREGQRCALTMRKLIGLEDQEVNENHASKRGATTANRKFDEEVQRDVEGRIGLPLATALHVRNKTAASATRSRSRILLSNQTVTSS